MPNPEKHTGEAVIRVAVDGFPHAEVLSPVGELPVVVAVTNDQGRTRTIEFIDPAKVEVSPTETGE